MPFQVSPGVNVTEIDLTTIVPQVAVSDGALAGVFRWGPVGERVVVDSETQLVNRFGKPTNFNAETWFVGASFLGYTNRLHVSRAANTAGLSPRVTGYVSANSRVIELSGNIAETNTVSLQLATGQVVIESGSNAVTVAIDSRIDDVINSSAFSLTTESAVSAVSGANTISVEVSVNTSATNTSVLVLASGNTADLGVGFLIDDSTDLAVVNTDIGMTSITQIINSTAIAVNGAIAIANGDATLTATKRGIVTLQFVTNTAFSAVANSGPIANLEYQIVKNEAHFTQKDGTFDLDTHFVARYPGDLGNSLQVSVCGNSKGYSSQINLAAYVNGVALPAGSRLKLEVINNSNVATYTIVGANLAVVNAVAYDHKSALQVTDNIEVGNTLLGVQYMKVTEIGDHTNYGTVNTSVAVTTVNGSKLVTSNNTTDLAAGMAISSGNAALVDLIVNNVVNSTAFYLTTAPTVNVTANAVTISPRAVFELSFEDEYKLAEDYTFSSTNSNTRVISRFWEFFNLMDGAPGQSEYNLNFGNSSINADEMHVVITDEGGKITGVPGTVLETYQKVSRATDAKSIDGATNYWKDVINDASQFVYAVNDLDGATSATAENLTNSTLDVTVLRFNNGRDGQDEATIPLGVLASAYDLFASGEDVDISLVLQGRARNFQLANYLIDNIAELRKDCVVFVSPQKADVVNNVGNEAAAIVNFRNNLRSSSYGVLDSGYKYMYDRYNDINRWIPLNGDIAGLCARTDLTNDPWWSPAGYNRGHIKNVIKLAFNPRKSERDTLYKAGANPVVTFPGQGTVLYGDKTLLAKSSAFDRINVRRLFIVLEKAISTASKYTLFEFNDEFTRSQFKNMVNPYLRDVKGRRGITDFLVVCDDSNNTPEVVDRNEFIGDIYIKPARSINFIQLNFVAVRSGVAFSEVVGKF